MTTRMVHPQHGATHAYDTSEIARLKNLGWEVEGEKPVQAPVVQEPVAPIVERKKPGPKPKAK